MLFYFLHYKITTFILLYQIFGTLFFAFAPKLTLINEKARKTV